MVAEMQIRGSTTKVPLEFVRIQPYVMPKIELSDARTEQIDLRVLPVVFRFKPPAGSTLYPGQQVDVYIGSK
jgi:HlyD family secretion protein